VVAQLLGPPAGVGAGDGAVDLGHRRRSTRLPKWAVACPHSRAVDRHWRGTTAVVNPRRSAREARSPDWERARALEPEPEQVLPAAVHSDPGAVAADLRSDVAVVAALRDTRPPAGSDGRGPHGRRTGAGDACATLHLLPEPAGGRGRRRPPQPRLQQQHTRAAAVHGDPAGRALCAGRDRGRGTSRRLGAHRAAGHVVPSVPCGQEAAASYGLREHGKGGISQGMYINIDFQ